jgi:hypothetical protein
MKGARAYTAALLAGLTSFTTCVGLSAQVATVLYGRVEDAVSRAPLANVRVFAADSSAAVLTDSIGEFALPLGPDAPLVILAERLGYLDQRFDLPQEARNRLSVLLLEPMAIELAGITVEEEAALDRLIQNLESRQNAFQGAVRAFDRARLDGLAVIGSAWDFVRLRNPWMFECGIAELCVRGRGMTFANPSPQGSVTVCIDGREAQAPTSELALIDMSEVALVELFGRGHVRIYTAEYLLLRARQRRTQAAPLGMGCFT